MVEAYHVETPDFAGPMDLLVFLVRRRELDVAYISVSAIASDYLDWVERTETLDIDNAGDFILLAAVLLQFKAAELLPAGEPDIADIEIYTGDTDRSREELMALRSTIARLAEFEEKQINLFDRGSIKVTGLEEELAGEMLSDVTMYDLATVFRELIRELPPEPTRVIEQIPFTLEGQIAFVQSFFKTKRRILFDRLAETLDSRLAVIMTFLAVLELMRRRLLEIRQPEAFGQLWLIMHKENSAED